MQFYHSALQLFMKMNMFLQREDPIIPVVLDQLHKFVKNLLAKFVNVAVIRNSGSDPSSVQYDRASQVDGMFTLTNTYTLSLTYTACAHTNKQTNTSILDCILISY